MQDSGNLLIVSNVLSDFDDIKSSHRIDDERFKQGIQFALLISTGTNRVDAYIEALLHYQKRLQEVKSVQSLSYK